MGGFASQLKTNRGRLALVLLLLSPVVFVVGSRRQSSHRELVQAAQQEGLRAEARKQGQALDALLKLQEAEFQMLGVAVAALEAHGVAGPLLSVELGRLLESRPEARALCLLGEGGEVLASAFRAAEERCPEGVVPSRLRWTGELRFDVVARVGQDGRRTLVGSFQSEPVTALLERLVSGGEVASGVLRDGDQVLLRVGGTVTKPPEAGASGGEWFTLQASEPVGERGLWLDLELGPVRLDRGSHLLTPTRIAWSLLAAVLALCGALLLSLQWLTLPLEHMTRAALQIADGNFRIRVVEEGPWQVRALARTVNQMADSLAKFYEETRRQALRYHQDVVLALEMLAKEQAAEVASQNEELKAQAQELHRHREVLAEQNRTLQEQNRELERASKLKSEFLANTSHELRTPLNAVIGFSELLLEELTGQLDAEQREYVEDIYRSGKHLLAMINDLLDLAKIEAGKMDVHRERVDLAREVGEAVDIARPLALRKNVRFEMHAEQELFCVGDAQRVRQVALNLFSNAVKFTPAGGSVTSIVRRSADGQALEMEVRDTGIGIDPAHHQLIFEEFRQVDGSASREYQGTGLGLSLVRKFVEAMGGTIQVVSKLGEGATFTVRFQPWVEERAALAAGG